MDNSEIAVRVTPLQNVGELLNINDFFIGVSKGEFPLFEAVSIQGDLPSINTANNPADVTSASSPGLHIFPTSAATIDIVSTSANDTFTAGTGARQIFIKGLDGSFDEVSETINLNGTTLVTTLSSYIRINELTVIGVVGSTGSNEGIITATHGIDVISTMQIDDGRALQAVFTVPNAKTALLLPWHYEVHTSSGGVAAIKEVAIKLKRRENLGAWIVHQISGSRIDGGGFNSQYKVFTELPAKSDIRIEVTTLSNSTAVGAGFELILVG